MSLKGTQRSFQDSRGTLSFRWTNQSFSSSTLNLKLNFNFRHNRRNTTDLRHRSLRRPFYHSLPLHQRNNFDAQGCARKKSQANRVGLLWVPTYSQILFLSWPVHRCHHRWRFSVRRSQACGWKTTESFSAEIWSLGVLAISTKKFHHLFFLCSWLTLTEGTWMRNMWRIDGPLSTTVLTQSCVYRLYGCLVWPVRR